MGEVTNEQAKHTKPVERIEAALETLRSVPATFGQDEVMNATCKIIYEAVAEMAKRIAKLEKENKSLWMNLEV
jgi:uncharacterized protein YlzI (FlbEa/FlbD family)